MDKLAGISHRPAPCNGFGAPALGVPPTVKRIVYRSVLGALAVLLAAAVTTESAAQTGAQGYPARPLRFVSPFSPGGTTDTLARLIGQKLTETWGQSVVIENRPGAGGTIGAEAVARAAPDGYTLLLTSVGAHAVSPALRSKLAYDAVRDFSPITQVASGHNILVVHPSLPVRSVQELISFARNKPGQLTFASGGHGTSPHMGGELFKSLARVDMIHVPYKGGGPAAIALLSGEVSLSFGSIATVLPQVRAGKLWALAVTGRARSSALPDLPTVAEAGVPGYELNSWYGVLAPAHTSPEIVNKLGSEIIRVLRLPDVRERMLHEGVEPAGTTPEEFGAYIRSEIAKWTRVVKATGARVD